MKMIDCNKSVQLFVFVTAFFSGISSLAMDIDKRIAALKGERSDMMRVIAKKSNGNSTMEYRMAMKVNEKSFSTINQKIEGLEKLRDGISLVIKSNL